MDTFETYQGGGSFAAMGDASKNRVSSQYIVLEALLGYWI
jgi:hypothetical protein